MRCSSSQQEPKIFKVTASADEKGPIKHVPEQIPFELNTVKIYSKSAVHWKWVHIQNQITVM